MPVFPGEMSFTQFCAFNRSFQSEITREKINFHEKIKAYTQQVLMMTVPENSGLLRPGQIISANYPPLVNLSACYRKQEIDKKKKQSKTSPKWLIAQSDLLARD